MGKESYLEAMKNKHNALILKNIATQGLYLEAPGTVESIRLNSGDEEPLNKIFYFYLEAPKSNKPGFSPADMIMQSYLNFSVAPNATALQCLQSSMVDGLWSLAIERQYEPNMVIPNTSDKYASDRYELTDRLLSSVLLVLKCPASRLCKDTKSIGPASAVKDYSTSRPFPVSDISKVLCPASQYDQVKAVFGEALVCKVDETEAWLCMQTDKLMDGNYFTGPQYAPALQSLIDKKELAYPFGLHLVRLATRRDFLKIKTLSQQLTKDGLNEVYKKPNTDGALLRRIVHSGEREDCEYALQHMDNKVLNELSVQLKIRPLDIAIEGKSIPMITSLLKAGANMDARAEDKEGKTSKQRALAVQIKLEDILSGGYEENLRIDKSIKQHPGMAELFKKQYK